MKNKYDLPSIVDCECFEELFLNVMRLKQEEDEKNLIAVRCGKKPRFSSIQISYDILVQAIQTRYRTKLEKHIKELEEKNEKDNMDK